MNIVVLAATERGLRLIECLIRLCPDDNITVFSFKEDTKEPKFLDNIQNLVEESGFVFYEAKRVGGDRWKPFWDASSVDLMFVVSWRYKIPRHIYSRARLGCIVFHDSLLPKYRGFAPTNWAIINGESSTGATMFFIDEKIDNGPIIDQIAVTINLDDTIREVMERVTEAYLNLLERNIQNLKIGKSLTALPIDQSAITYTCKRVPEDNAIDWRSSSLDIYNLIRAVTYPYPGAFTTFRGRLLYIWSARLVENEKLYVGCVPGRVVEIGPDKGAIVLTGDGAILLREIQLEGESIKYASDVLTSITATLGRWSPYVPGLVSHSGSDAPLECKKGRVDEFTR
jgi:methionyl-tRNA formyltransferase